MRVSGLTLAAAATLAAGALFLLLSGNRLPMIGAPDGQLIYFDHCAVCHGPDGRGVVNQGVPLASSAFVSRLSDQDLKSFIKTGRPGNSPESLTGEDMLPVDDLEEPQYDALIRFLRRL